MRRIFTLSMALVCLTLISNKSIGQICGPIVEDFNTAANGTAGFSGTPVNSLTNAANALEFNTEEATNLTYTLTTHTYQLQATSAPISFGFILNAGARINVSNITVAVKYVNTSGAIFTSSPTTLFSGSLTNAAQTFCQTTTTPPDIATSGPSQYSYQLVFTFKVDGLTGNGARVFSIDDYRTNNTIAQIVLPVHFNALSVRKAADAALINWSVGTEQNVSSYDVEKSTDGRSFTKIGYVEAKGQSSYSFADTKAGAVNFYRIKSVDFDGKYNYSTVVVLNNGAASVVVKAFMSDKNTLTVQHDAAQAGSRISVVSMDGRVVKLQQPNAGAQQTTVDLSAAQTGLYIVRYDNGQGGTQSIKVAK